MIRTVVGGMSKQLGIGLHYNIPAADYHADPCPRPSLSSSIAAKLATLTPKHAWQAHPRLGGKPPEEEPEDDHTEAKGRGSIIHELLLGGGKGLAVIEADNFRTKVAQETRDAALAAGQVPVLRRKLDEYEITARILRVKLEDRGIVLGQASGATEVTGVWEEDGVLCRCRMDIVLSDPRPMVLDLKTRLRPVQQRMLSRSMEDYHEHISYAAYRRCMRKLAEMEVPMAFVYAEITPPYEVMICQPGEPLAELGERDWCMARALWKGCIETGEWPGHPLDVVRVEASSFQIARLEMGEVA